MCFVYIVVIITIIIQDPLEKKPILQKEEPELLCVGVVNKDTVLSYVYYESTPDSSYVEKCLEHTIPKLTTMELAYKPSFEDIFNKMQDSIYNRRFDVRIDHIRIHKSYLDKSFKTKQ